MYHNKFLIRTDAEPALNRVKEVLPPHHHTAESKRGSQLYGHAERTIRAPKLDLEGPWMLRPATFRSFARLDWQWQERQHFREHCDSAYSSGHLSVLETASCAACCRRIGWTVCHELDIVMLAHTCRTSWLERARSSPRNSVLHREWVATALVASRQSSRSDMILTGREGHGQQRHEQHLQDRAYLRERKDQQHHGHSEKRQRDDDRRQ